MIVTVSRAMAEQNAAASDIAGSATSMRQQADQAAKALKEQARAMRDMTSAAANTATQIKQITHANREQSVAAAAIVRDLEETRRVTERNASGVKQTRGSSADLVRYAQALTAVVDDLTKKPH
jgi:methyl-accepting chemotaxis protein